MIAKTSPALTVAPVAKRISLTTPSFGDFISFCIFIASTIITPSPAFISALLEKIRALPNEHGGQIPAVALTAFNRPEDREAAFDAGFQKHLGKPVEPEDLISAIIETAGAK